MAQVMTNKIPATNLRERLIRTMKPDNLHDEPALLESYAVDRSFMPHGHPELVVYPENSTDVQQIVRAANETLTPLIPVSSGPPHFHGDTVPVGRGAIVDFSRMNRILEIDAVSRYTRIEPGVTYTDLIPELRKEGLRICTPLLPRSSKSVLTSVLEREPTLIPKYQYDYMDPLLTLEVIYGTGDDFRTGSASGPGTLETLKADKVNPWGPGSIDYYRLLSAAQGSMGLVTWAVMKTEVLPRTQELYFITAQNVSVLVECTNALLLRRVGDECLILDNIDLANILISHTGGDFESVKTGLPPWTLFVSIAGYERRPEQRIAIQKKYLNEICSAFDLTAQTDLPGIRKTADDFLELLSSPWEEDPHWKLRRAGAAHDIFFLAPMSKVAVLVNQMKQIIAETDYSPDQLGTYLQPMVQGRGCHCEFTLFLDDRDEREATRIEKLIFDSSQKLMRAGAFFSRPYGPWAEMVYKSYPEGVTALKKLKDIFDPNHILNPGKLCL